MNQTGVNQCSSRPSGFVEAFASIEGQLEPNPWRARRKQPPNTHMVVYTFIGSDGPHRQDRIPQQHAVGNRILHPPLSRKISSCFGKANAKNTLELLMRGTSCTPYPFPCLFGEYDCVGFWPTCLSWNIWRSQV